MKETQMKNKTYLASVKKLILAVVVGFGTLGLGAAEATIDGVTWKYTVNSNGATIQSDSQDQIAAVPTATSGAVIVPSELGGFPVVEIGGNAFHDCSKITSVQIPEGVVYIGYTAFHGCTSLMSFNIPNSVDRVCIGLEDTALWKDAEDGLVIIDGWVLDYKGSCPKEIVIPSGAVGLAQGAFYSQEFLESVEISEGVRIICSSAFGSCSSISSIKLPSSLVVIESSAFSGCESLTTVTIPANVESIGNMAFRSCIQLKSLHFEAGPKTIQMWAFSDCQALETVTIPEGVTAIEDSAFMGCVNLKSVSLPASLSYLGESVFEPYSNNDMEITIDPNNNYFCAENGLLLTKDRTQLLVRYNLSMIRDGVLEIPEGVKIIGARAFSFCYGFTTLKLPTSVEEIGESAFEYCGDLNTIVFSTGLKTIGYAAFAGCNGLTKIAFPDGLEKIGGFAFGSNGGIVPLSFPESLKCVGAWAFGDADFVIGSDDGLLIVDGCLIKYKGACPSEVTIPEGVRVIAADAFAGQTGLTSVTIPATLKGMGDGYNDAFSGCTGLKKVCISDLSAWCGIEFNDSRSPLRYARHLYLNGQEIFDLVIPDGVTDISASAFEYCSSLSSVTMPAEVKKIGLSAFAHCDGMRTATFLGTPPKGLTSSGLLASGRKYYYPPEEFPRQWKQYVGVYGIDAFAGYAPADIPVSVEVLSSEIRASDPTVMDVVYKVTSGRPKVRVRALAFKDGERSFANVIRPETFIDGTAANIGDEIEANVTHKLSWRVSADYGIELAKLKFEVLANVGDLLPFTWITIPKSESYGTMRVSRNEITGVQIFDALMWLYAAKDPSLTLTDGMLKQGAIVLANGTTTTSKAAVRAVFDSMGFGMVDGGSALLQYVNEETRLGLAPNGFRQYAYRLLED